MPGRLGGDEFAVVLPTVGSAAEATGVADRILADCRRPLTLAATPCGCARASASR
ncbi:diguanylate cyclase domain-containing protein [Actinoplanes sp. CA-030573]|uniref:diguanylate cyclase domain-containing protein n=1 Tax=Actinoplanes sp. CA-030573 TaxID=3239898 RepID=UPI003D8A7106